MSGILGKKLGMTQIFSDTGDMVSVTAIEAGPCPVLAIMDKKLKLGFDVAGTRTMQNPLLGYFKKLNVAPRRYVREVRRDLTKEFKVGEELKADVFKPGDFVDIAGTTKGKGFQGGMKRWNWKGGPNTHGSTSHRRVGSLGSTTTPGRVWKGHHMAGHMGNDRLTVQNLLVVKVDQENNLILVRGAVPGCKNSYLIISKAKKKKPLYEREKPKLAAGKKAKK